MLVKLCYNPSKAPFERIGFNMEIQVTIHELSLMGDSELVF